MITTIGWNAKEYRRSLFPMVPDTEKDVVLIMKDSKRYPDTHGWAYAEFAYDSAPARLRPLERRQVRRCVTSESGGKSLHFHDVRTLVNGERMVLNSLPVASNRAATLVRSEVTVKLILEAAA
jgi:hypothetical protein